MELEVIFVSARSPRTKSSSKESGSEKTLDRLPVKEKAWVRMKDANENIFVTTANPDRTIFTLYQVVENGFVKVAKAANPKELDAIVYPLEMSQKAVKLKK